MQKSYRQSGVGMLDAAPGTYMVHAYFDDNQVDLVKCNVIGWQIAQDRRLTPLVLDPRAVTPRNAATASNTPHARRNISRQFEYNSYKKRQHDGEAKYTRGSRTRTFTFET